MKFKTLILSCVFAGLSVLAWMWWDSSSATAKIDEAFESKNYPLYLELVQKNSKKFSVGKKHLFLAYEFAANGELEKSNDELDIAIQQLDNSSELNLEIVLNQSLNAYLANNLHALNLYIDQIDLGNPAAREWKRLFQGALALKLDHCSEALKQFSVPLRLEALNPQMHRHFAEKIPPAWNALQLAACEIGMGQFNQARVRLREPGLIVTPYEKELAHALMGKSYWMEGNTKKNKDSMFYYGLAIGEFSKVPTNNHEFHILRNEIIGNMQTRLQEALDNRQVVSTVFFDNALNHYLVWESRGEPVAVVVRKDSKAALQEVSVIVKDQQYATPFPSQEEWESETPLDWNYAMIQGRIDSILEGERLWTNLDKQLEEDSAFLNLLTQIKPPLSPVFFLLGQVELLRERDREAIQAFSTYVELEPSNPWGWKLLALSQVGIGDTVSAVDSFYEVIKINPVDLAAWKSLGKIHLGQNKSREATRAYENALVMDPQDLEIILSLNQLYNQQKNRELAQKVIHGVYHRHTGNPLIIQALHVTIR